MMLAHSKNLTNDLYDPETGQQFFQPQVGRAPTAGRPRAGQGTSDNLYKAGQVATYKKMTRMAEKEYNK